MSTYITSHIGGAATESNEAEIMRKRVDAHLEQVVTTPQF